MRLSVVLGEWLDRPIEADLAVAVEADRLGYGELWIGEMAKLDAPAMAAAVVARTERIEPVLGPLAVTVRSPAQIALATATVAATGRRTHVALGTSSDVVARWHGRDRGGAVGRLETATRSVKALLAGERVAGFRLRQPPPTATVTVAAFGPRAVSIAANADRMVLNMVTVDAAAGLAAGHPNTAAWLAAAVDPTPAERRWMSLGFVGYLAAPGYGEMFTAAGFGDLVAFARTRPHPRDVADRLPDDLLDAVAIVGSEREVTARIDAYARAGLTEIGLVVPPLDSPSGRSTLEALAPTPGTVSEPLTPPPECGGMGNPAPQLHLTTAIGRARTDVAALDQALLRAGLADCNIVRRSSAIPPGAEIVHGTGGFASGCQWGERIDAVYAEHTVGRVGDQTWAGVGWVQDVCTGQGLFVEHGGGRELAVRRAIAASLEDLQSARGRTFGPIHMRLVGATCTGAPTCALVICVFAGESGPCC